MVTLDTTLPRAQHRTERILPALTGDWHRLAAAAAVALLLGLLSAFLMPRGPVIAQDGLLVMGIGLAVGVLTGVLVRRAWAIVPVGLGQRFVSVIPGVPLQRVPREADRMVAHAHGDSPGAAGTSNRTRFRNLPRAAFAGRRASVQ